MKNITHKIVNTLKSFMVVSLFAASTATYADDTEVFYTENITNNLLFLLDVSGSMKEKIITRTVVGGGTTGSGGDIGTIENRTAENIKDDASQNFNEVEAPSAGAQQSYEDELNFEPDNIVATRFRFDWDKIPKNATITNAYITFKAASDDADETVNGVVVPTEIDVSIENRASTYAASAYSNNKYWYKHYYYYHQSTNFFPSISSRSYTAPVRWTPAAWNQNSSYQTLDVKSLVQQVVNRNDWGEKANNKRYVGSLAFKFVTVSGKRAAYSRDYSNANAPQLHVEYEYDEEVETGGNWEQVLKWSWWWGYYYDWEWVPTYGTVTTTETLNTNVKKYWRIDAAYDDAEQEFTSSSTQQQVYAESQLAFNSNQEIALRFNLNTMNPNTGIVETIPQGSIITDAYLQFTAAGDSSVASSINIKIEDTGFALDYDDVNPKIRERNYTGNKLWTVPAWTTGDSSDATKTPKLVNLVQHVVDKSDWNNALAFKLFVNTDTSERIAHAFDAGANVAPVLYIKYQNLNGATTGTTTTGGVTVITEVNTRLEVMQNALREVLSIEGAPKVNVGLMKYSGMPRDVARGFDSDDNVRQHYVGGVVFPIAPLYEKAIDHLGSYTSRDNLIDPGSTKTVGEFIPDVADEWWPQGGTPIVDALYEAALYFRGEPMHYGKNKNNTDDFSSPGSHPASYFNGAEIDDEVGDVGRASISAGNYKSPITRECQSNYLVLMSDGKPTYYHGNGDGSDNQGPLARAMVGSGSTGTLKKDLGSSCLNGNAETGNTGTELEAGSCGREITQYLATEDQIPTNGRGGNVGMDGIQTVNTFTIGFGSGLEDGAEEYLRSLETIEGEGGFYTAEHKEELKSAFQNIFETVIKSSGSLSSPGYSVNVKSGLEHEDDIYIPIFDRKSTSRWAGNLKKFKLVNDDGKRKIRGANDQDAFTELGAFEDVALDYWSKNTTPDGAQVEKGGVAELITPVNRKVFSNLDCDADCALNTGEDYKLLNSNSDITAAMLGIDETGLTDAEIAQKRTQLINFTRGWVNGFHSNDTGTPRHHMGDMLHAEPLVITYANAAADGTGKQQYIFAGTNEGYLHAFDAETGLEKFAFMPKALLENADALFKNAGTARDHKYGIDGVMTYWHEDGVGGDKNGVVDGTEKVYLYFGLRRGGRAYYALEVSDINNPKLVWKVDNADTGMSLLGQSWSAPYLARIGLADGTKKEVMIISGGYDDAEDRDKVNEPKVLDDATTAVTATMGHNIYILDAKNGDLLWSLRESMSNTVIQNSIPGGLRMLDMNSNGVVDRMYFADTGGNVWRLDLSESLNKTGDNKSALTKLASLGGSGVDSRKFYNEPDVATLNTNGKRTFMISIGSGFRAHPNDKVINDKFFIIKDSSPYSPLADDFEAIEITNLASVEISGSGENITLNKDGFGDEGTSKGWYLSLPDGEKSLATAVTFDGIVTFTTLIPETVTDGADPCAAPIAYGRLYALNILTGDASLDLDESGKPENDDEGEGEGEGSSTIDHRDPYIRVVKGEIPGKPQVVFNAITRNVTSDDKKTCKHPVDLRSGKKLTQVTGYDACRLESVYWNDPEQD